ncbi:MAG: hypothetical protein RM347_004290 [Nostoc sp. ChiQUE02]|uniref:hypothetical protein n=1 Tax=Nostoc sp. ChiQUE02 TaxID=3075377 RepID=UPI002AD471A5|nr:hypothetical protein [Nostoc sp. ChiQUE02]MDZ8234557.1 hypothetical protein [Nostoc sp. ChiQUE02]
MSLKDPQGFNFPESEPFTEFASLQPLIVGTRLHLGVILAVVAAVLIWGVLRQKFFVRVVGFSPKAAVYAGINSDVYDRLCLRKFG